MKENRPSYRAFRAALCLIAGAMLLCRCDERSARRLSGGNARAMQVTSAPAEIGVSSSKVPGYWAKQTSDGEVFFLSTPAEGYEAGDLVEVKGPFGFAMASVFDVETRIYQKNQPVNILIVWEISRAGPRDDAAPAGGRIRGR